MATRERPNWLVGRVAREVDCGFVVGSWGQFGCCDIRGGDSVVTVSPAE